VQRLSRIAQQARFSAMRPAAIAERQALAEAIDRANLDPRVLYCNRTGAAVSNDAIWSRNPADRRLWLLHSLDLKLQRSAAVSAVMDDFGNLVEVAS
jgi:hypothetical protein